jgi:hypothetical protein
MLKKEIYSFYNTRQTGKDQLLYRIIKSDSSIDNTQLNLLLINTTFIFFTSFPYI